MSNNLQKRSASDFVFIGLALFAMFFGAGNLIFPPDIGVRSGPDWFIGFLCFFIADAGLAVIGMLSMVKANGRIENVTGVIGKTPSTILATAVILCIGPGIAIPRTATVTYGLGLAPVFNIAADNKWALPVFSVVFFLIVLALTIKPTRVVDIVGKVLTPVLVVALLIMIVIGFVSPKGSISDSLPGTQTVQYGILNGYQTMDGMASLFFAIIVISAVYAKGYTSRKDSTSMTIKASVVAGILLFIVYGGLAYLGATTGTLWKSLVGIPVKSGGVDQAGLVINITNALMGKAGVVILGIVVALACLTTAIGLTSATAEYFHKLSKGKLKYSHMVIAVCVFSAFICNLGLATILKIAVPILLLVYPIVVLLLVVTLFRRFINKQWAYKLAAIAALIVSAITVLGDTFDSLKESFAFIHKLPLDAYGFNWLIPTLIALVIGMIIPGPKLNEMLPAEIEGAEAE